MRLSLRIAVSGVLIVLLSSSSLFAQEMKKNCQELLYWRFKPVRGFGLIEVHFEGDDAEKILDREEMKDYALLRFKNNFGKVEYKELRDEEMLKALDLSNPDGLKLARETGYIGFTIWLVGDDYPIAYNVKCHAGTFEEMKFHEDEILGYGSRDEMKDIIKSGINRLLESLAINFFKARGEL